MDFSVLNLEGNIKCKLNSTIYNKGLLFGHFNAVTHISITSYNSLLQA